MAIRTHVENGKKIYEVYVNGFDARGTRVQRRRRGLKSLRQAEVAEFELKMELAKLKDVIAIYTWSEWLEECLRRMRLAHRPSTVIDYQTRLGKWITPLWGPLELKEVSKQMVYDAIFTELDQKLSPYSKRNVLKLIRRIFEMAVEEGLLDRNPTVGIRVNVPEVDQKVFTNSEVEIFLQEAKITNHRFYPIWAMALMTGMRSGELFALKWTDIDFEGRTISVSRQWTNKNGFGPTKTRRSRVVPISDDLLIFLKERKVRMGAAGEFVLPHLTEWQNGEQAQVTRDFCASVGITPVRFHDLRATFITNLLSRGVSLARVMALVGHSQIKTTNGYLRRAGVELRGTTNELGYGLPNQVGVKVLSFDQRG